MNVLVRSKQRKCVDGKHRCIEIEDLQALSNELASFRDPKTYDMLSDTVMHVTNKDDLKFWREYANKQEDDYRKTRIIKRHNELAGGARDVHSAKLLKNIDHLRWWHSQYPNEGFDVIATRIELGAVCAEDAAGVRLTNAQAQYWWEKTNDTAFQIKLILDTTQNHYGLLKLDGQQIGDIYYLARQSKLHTSPSPLTCLDALCRMWDVSVAERDIQCMMEDFTAEELWTMALTFRWSVSNGTWGKTWHLEAYELLARLHPVHHNEFWPIRNFLIRKSFGWNEMRLFKIILSLCNENPRTAFITQLALTKGERVVEALNEWAAPPAYTE